MDMFAATLSTLAEGTDVAVVTLLGSLCPVTRGHIIAFLEARRLLLGEDDMPVSRPARLQPFGEMVGLISLNGSSYVNRKLTSKGTNSISMSERHMLVRLAVAELPWISTEETEGCTLDALRSSWPHLRFTHFYMNGADDVRRHRKWTWAGPECRMLTMGRPGDTEAVLQSARNAGVDLEDGTFIMGPELPDVSSSDARTALSRGDVASASAMLHPDVLAWCVEHGPWTPLRDARASSDAEVDHG